MTRRTDIFLDFFNRDSRQIYGLFQQSAEKHKKLLSRALNSAILICDSRCIAPPGFFLECDIAMNLLIDKRDFLNDRLIELPIRESSLSHFAEKKRRDYKAVKKSYSGLFDDNKIILLSENTPGVIQRNTTITEQLIKQWNEGPDLKTKPWASTIEKLPACAIESIRKIPTTLYENGIATTWLAIEKRLAKCNHAHKNELRKILQHDYFSLYINEYNLNTIFNIPYMGTSFYLPAKSNAYNYEWINSAFREINLPFIFDCCAESICKLKHRVEITEFLNAFYTLCGSCQSKTDIQIKISKAIKSARVKFPNPDASFTSDREPKLSDTYINEFCYSLEHLLPYISATPLFPSHSISSKGAYLSKSSLSLATEMHIVPSKNEKIVLFVALEEEFNVLVNFWNLDRKFGSNYACGLTKNNASVCVVCAQTMGRVSAAVSTCNFLSERKDGLPLLLVIVGLAGGFEEEGIEEGMLLFPKSVVDLATRKIKELDNNIKTEFRRHDYSLNTCLYDYVTSSNFDRESWITKATKEAEWPDSRRPSFKTGLISSLDEVVSSSDWRKTLLTNSPKLLGVEMEAGGVCAAAETFRVPVAMIRAVSDMADPSKTDTMWRSRGMKTIASLLEEINWNEIIAHLEQR